MLNSGLKKGQYCKRGWSCKRELELIDNPLITTAPIGYIPNMYFLLAIIGAATGAFVNACICRLGEEKSKATPWTTPPDGIQRQALHYVPLLGWWYRRDEAQTLGNRFWLRPFAIELTWLIGLPYFYHWIYSNALTGGIPAPVPWQTAWFIGHSILFALLFIATFIDFDQKIIPDWITVPGTLIALLIAAIEPGFRLPKIATNLVGSTIESIHFADGANLPTWHHEIGGLVIAILILMIWAVALLPKYPLVELNLHGLKLVFVSTARLLRHNGLKGRAKAVRMGRTFLTIGVIGSILLAVGWSVLPPAHWTSLFGATFGLALGGLSIWLVRIVASHSLGQEAMGFGDVTLMAMIGAFLGWQAAFVTFAISPFAALAIAVVSVVLTGNNKLAFGPYLCFGAMLSIFSWSYLWPRLLPQFFAFPKILMAVLAMSLVMLMAMLLVVRFLKGGFADEESDEDEQA